MTGFVWHELSEAMMGRPHGKALAVALALALATLLLLRHFGRALTNGRPTERRASGSKTHD